MSLCRSPFKPFLYILLGPSDMHKYTYKKNLWSYLMVQQVKDLCCHWSGLGCCCGAGSIPGLGTSVCQEGTAEKKKKKMRERDVYSIKFHKTWMESWNTCLHFVLSILGIFLFQDTFISVLANCLQKFPLWLYEFSHRWTVLPWRSSCTCCFFNMYTYDRILPTGKVLRIFRLKVVLGNV